MKTSYLFILIMVIGSLTSCSDSDPVSPAVSGLSPLNNGSGDRDLVVVISDIHLGANLAYAEINKNLPLLEKFLEEVRLSPNIKELVIAGDLIDEWFVPANINTYEGKGQQDFVSRVANTNKGVVNALNRIAGEGKIKVTYVPGNHDVSIIASNFSAIFPQIIQSREEIQGLGTYSPEGLPEVVIEHGHRYNYFVAPDPVSNRDIAPGSIMPPGYFFTRVAALHVFQNCKTPIDSIPEISYTPSADENQNAAYAYWKVWKALMTQIPINNKFDEKIIVTNIDGFTNNYSVNDLIPYQLSPGGKIDMNLYKNISDNWKERQRINKVPFEIPASQSIINALTSAEIDNQAVTQYFKNPNSNKRVVIFGHTHDAKIIPSLDSKGEKTVYANSGTWIDINPYTTKMNFVIIKPQLSSSNSQTHIDLYNFEGAVFTKMAADSLRF